MKQLLKKLLEMQKQGYEYITIQEVIKIIRNIQWDTRAKRIEKKYEKN